MHHTRRFLSVVTLLSVVAGALFLLSATSLRSSAMEEQDMPAASTSQDQPIVNGAQAAESPDRNRGDDWVRVPPDNDNGAKAPEQIKSPATQVAPGNPQSVVPSPWPAATSPAQTEAVRRSSQVSATPAGAPPLTPMPLPSDISSAAPTPEPPPALDVSSIATDVDMETRSLDPEIKTAATPSMAASLRVTEQARKQLAKGSIDAGLRSLTQAVSIDPGDPFAYYFLGRAYFERKNYQQALTFFERARLGFNNQPDMLGETMSYEGACEEALGHELEAAKAYQRAVALAPGNFRARVGYGRLSAILVPTPGPEIPQASGDNAPPAPSGSVDAPPPSEPMAPPAP